MIENQETIKTANNYVYVCRLVNIPKLMKEKKSNKAVLTWVLDVTTKIEGVSKWVWGSMVACPSPDLVELRSWVNVLRLFTNNYAYI